MFVPFYDNIEKQEFRKHEDREFLLPETAIITYRRQLIPFQYIVSDFGVITKVELIGISTTGRILRIQELPASYMKATSLGDGDWRIRCDGAILESEIELNLFYIKLSAGDLVKYSEVFCRVQETTGEGYLLLNTGGRISLNKQGSILLNDSNKPIVIKNPVEFNYKALKNFGKFDLLDFNGKFYIDGIVNFERSIEENDSENYDGLRYDFEKIVSSVYSIQYWASRQECDLLNQLYFFEELTITDSYGNIYTPEEPVSVLKEREEPTGFYKITIEFKINNKLNYSELETAEGLEADVIIGEIIQYPAVDKTIAQQLDFLTETYTNFTFVEAVGQQLQVSDHPKAATVFPNTSVGGIPVFDIPDFRGVVMVGVGIHTDSRGSSNTFTAGERGTYEHLLTSQQLPPHTHALKFTKQNKFGSDTRLYHPSGTEELQTGENLTGNLPHNNIQPSRGIYNIVVKWYKHLLPPK